MFAVEYAQVNRHRRLPAAASETAPVWRFAPSTPALSLLFVDISLQRSAKAEKCRYFPHAGFAKTMAAAIENRTAEAQAWSKASRVAGVDILHDLSQAETIWRGLESPRQFSTPYQRFD
ncbi:MAG TPA: hypothetical protein VF396_12160, partial [Bradyrhizobium sp.]